MSKNIFYKIMGCIAFIIYLVFIIFVGNITTGMLAVIMFGIYFLILGKIEELKELIKNTMNK